MSETMLDMNILRKKKEKEDRKIGYVSMKYKCV